MRWLKPIIWLSTLILASGAAFSCTLCSSVKLVTTIREDLANAHCNLVMYGRLGLAKLNSDGTGTTLFHPEKILRQPVGWNQPPEFSIPKYLPGGEKSPNSRTVLFLHVSGKQVDPLRAIRLENSGGLAQIMPFASPLPPQPQPTLLLAFERMNGPEPELAQDGFMEWAKADDNLVSETAAKLDARIVRRLAEAPNTPPERLGLFAFLLGSCGTITSDKAWFEEKVTSAAPRWKAARDGILAGYIRLCPKEGWAVTTRMLADGQMPLQERLSAIRAVKMSVGFQTSPTGTKLKGLGKEPQDALKAAIEQGEIADIAIDYLRQWRVTELEETVLKAYPGRDRSPLLARGVIHYALSWPNREGCSKFLSKIRMSDPELVKEVEELAGPSER